MLVGILAAVMSSADICILTSSANLTRDLYQRYINPDVDQKSMLRLSMWSSVAAGLLATLMAWKMQDIIDVLMLGFTINSAALFIPTMAALLYKRSDPTAAFWSVALSLPTVILWKIAASAGLQGVFVITPLWPGLTVSLVTFVIMTLRSKTTPFPANR